MVHTLVARGRDTTLIDLRLAELPAGGRESVRDDECELCAVVLSGTVEVAVGGRGLGTAARAGGVFAAPPVAAYVPPGAALSLAAADDAVVALAGAPVAAGTAGAARLIEPSDRQVRSAGTGNWSRTIRTLLGPDEEAGRLIVGETVNPPGNWSSYPPHKHDRQAPPEEVALEEVYLYRFAPHGGFGVQLLYDAEREDARVVHDGDVVVIPSGYHPVVAAPGYALYYLWVMAGEGRELAPHLDPRHAWVQA